MNSIKVGNVTIAYPGHASFVIEGSKVVYTDPYVLPPNPKKADVILITHGHYDHCANVDKLSKPGTAVAVPGSCASKVPNPVVFSPGKAANLNGVEIKAVQSYNVGKPFHPKGVGLGYVFTIDGVKIYVAGDTDFIPEMSALASEKIDVALLPIGGTYTMDIEQAVKATIAIKPKIVVPMHYNYVEGTEAEPENFKLKLKNLPVEVRILD